MKAKTEKLLGLSEYASNFIPKDAKIFLVTGHGSLDGDCTVKGFYDPKTGKYHIQEIMPNKIYSS